MTDPLTKELAKDIAMASAVQIADHYSIGIIYECGVGSLPVARSTIQKIIEREVVAAFDAAQATPEPAQRTDPTPEQMLKGADDLEAIAQGIRDCVAGRVTPFEEVQVAAQPLDIRGREWSVHFLEGPRYRSNEAGCRDVTNFFAKGSLQFSDDHGLTWQNADTSPEKEQG